MAKMLPALTTVHRLVLLVFAIALAPAVVANTGSANEFPSFTRRGAAIDYEGLKYNPTNDVIFPSVIRTEPLKNPLGKYYMYYAPHNAPGGICLAYTDSLTGPWHEYDQNPIIRRDWQPHYRVSHISSPHALWIDEEGKLFLWFHGENNTTRYASSEDGIRFEYEGVAVSTRDFDGISEASYARVFKHQIPGKDNQYVILLMGNDQGTRRIYLGWSKDARSWATRRGPLISPLMESGQTASPWLFSWNGRLYVLHHVDVPTGRGLVADIVATEVDPQFEKVRHAGVFFKATAYAQDFGRVASPCVVREGGQVYLFYDSGMRLHNRIGVAVAEE